MAYSNLQVYYKTIWSMVHHHGWALSELENLVPYERDIYVDMTSKHIQDTETAMQQQAKS